MRLRRIGAASRIGDFLGKAAFSRIELGVKSDQSRTFRRLLFGADALCQLVLKPRQRRQPRRRVGKRQFRQFDLGFVNAVFNFGITGSNAFP